MTRQSIDGALLVLDHPDSERPHSASPSSIAEALEHAVRDPVGHPLPPPERSESGFLDAAKPPTSLAARLLYSRVEHRAADTPIAYRKYVYAVAPWCTEDELRQLLNDLFSQVVASMAGQPAGNQLELWLFDHVFEDAPRRPPMAMLIWKDWRGDAVVTISEFAANEPRATSVRQGPATHEVEAPTGTATLAHGGEEPPEARHLATAPPGAGSLAHETRGAAAAAVTIRAEHGDTIRGSEATEEPADETHENTSEDTIRHHDVVDAPPQDTLELPRTDSVGLDRNGLVEEVDALFELFARMGDLRFLVDDLNGGVEHVVTAVAEVIPCEGILVHIYDARCHEFVVLRAVGPHAEHVIGYRTGSADPALSEVSLTGELLRTGQDAEDGLGPARRWAELGVDPKCYLGVSVNRGDWPFVAIEMVNPITGPSFIDNEAHALAYACEKLTEFMERHEVLADDVTNERAPNRNDAMSPSTEMSR